MSVNYKMVEIHPLAQIGSNVEIGSFSVIEDDVIIGEGTWIGPHVTIMKGTRIGNNCRIFPGAVLGAIPQDLKFGGEYTLLEIGNNVTVREYCTLNRGTAASNTTIIGDNTLLMAYVHIAHDCVIGQNCIIANATNLAGHVELGDYSIIGGMSAVHQFVKIGPHAMISGGSLVRMDVPPFVKAAREPLGYVGVNTIGLSRRGFSKEEIEDIQEIYRELFVKGYNISHALQIIQHQLKDSAYKEKIVTFIKSADRGLMKGYQK